MDKRSNRLIDLKDKRFGKLVVLEKIQTPKKYKNKSTYWLCKCDCGKTKIIIGTSLKSGATKSCGCIGKKYAWCYTGIELS